LNLLPPGPQPERSGVAQLTSPAVVDFLAAEFLWVALRLDPKLDPKHVFGPGGRDMRTRRSAISQARAGEGQEALAAARTAGAATLFCLSCAELAI